MFLVLTLCLCFAQGALFVPREVARLERKMFRKVFVFDFRGLYSRSIKRIFVHVLALFQFVKTTHLFTNLVHDASFLDIQK
jgi:hypothetical protein